MTDQMTSAEYRRLMDLPEAGSLSDTMDLRTPESYTKVDTASKTSKYGAVRTTVDGIVFASKAEASRYVDLMRLQDAGEINGLELQPKYMLVVNGIKIGYYQADFWYWEIKSNRAVIEDVKGMKTPVYRLKKKLMKAIYGFEIRETS